MRGPRLDTSHPHTAAHLTHAPAGWGIKPGNSQSCCRRVRKSDLTVEVDVCLCVCVCPWRHFQNVNRPLFVLAVGAGLPVPVLLVSESAASLVGSIA